ncbi:SDR family NAD(P)-dependent oxidoreductase [Nocardioides sp. T2.26MG-1]|uniref:SDR family NAD(P)-dependent oxidoreductase n=1 Tax=Nocardioides sp. T2.26MG-1 TaxID=3041166 RepID=UPI00247779AA|nr:SDR family NAD(P)-dependent oxidoreductase [Nocardioides sp. T2.26MG-1]CAI9406733.1 3-oxoacyl-[acyl-carrier-protein] reductase FabG [Nocardioides sp. T2.26MG-1]
MNKSTTMERVAIVTGADIARRLASDGLAVAVADRDEPACQAVVEEIEAAGGRGLAVRVDVSDEQAVQDGVEQIVTQLGEPTVLVNNAGIIRDNLLFRMTVEEWDAVTNMKHFSRIRRDPGMDAALNAREEKS